MIEIRLNGKQKGIPADSTIVNLLESLELQGQRLAVEVNQQIVPRSEHKARKLQLNDQVEIVRAIGGG